MFNFIENIIRYIVVFITNFLPVKVIRDDRGVPFLYRYHLFTFSNDGAGVCFHHFVKSDPDRGYHDHPWKKAFSFILCGGYKERIIHSKDNLEYTTYNRNRWTFNFLDGQNDFHRVILDDNTDAWTIFFFQKREKTWGIISLDGNYKQMSNTIYDQDGGWWTKANKGKSLHKRINNNNIVAAVDIIVLVNNKVLLIKRGKNPFKDWWAFPGGRIENTDKDIISAAYRELKEETNIENIDIKYVNTIGNSTRDPRGFTVTNIFLGKLDKMPDIVRAGDDAVDFKWFDINELPLMAFDHKEILLSVLL